MQPPGKPFPILGMLICVLAFFEREITKYCGRHALCASLPFEGACANPPRDFLARLLREHIGLGDRNYCRLASKMHAVIDLLVEWFRGCADGPKPKEEILRDVCDALVQINYYRNFFTCGPCRQPPEEGRFQFDPCELTETALQIAIIKGYSPLLFSGPTALPRSPKGDDGICTRDCTGHCGWTIHHAIRFGRPELLRQWFGRDTLNLNRVPSLRRAFAEAAKAGRMKGFVWIAIQIDDHVRSASILIDVAAEYQDWNVVQILLDFHGKRMDAKTLMSVLCWAARHGKDDMITEAMKYDVRPRTMSRPACTRWPIREAVRGGHISTVQLLLDSGAMGDEIESHGDVLARYVAMSGNFAVFQLLKEYYFWKRSSEYNFLPIAAEFGHVDFAEYAITRLPKLRGRKKKDDKMGMPVKTQLQYFSLFRAIVRGQCDVVRLIVQRADLDLDQPICCWFPYAKLEYESQLLLTPLVLAVDAGNADMVRLLVDLGVEPLSEEKWEMYGYPNDGNWQKDRCHARDQRRLQLECWRFDLNLADDYATRYTSAPWTAVVAAHMAATNTAV